MKIIGLDVGEKRIGVAKADSEVRIAVPVGFVLADGSEWQEIARIGRLNGTNLFVLGLPRSNEGNETRQTQYVRHFAKELQKNVPGAKVAFQDESLTSVVAEERLKERGKRFEKGDTDAEAATIILQDFLENFSKEKFDKPVEEKKEERKEERKPRKTRKIVAILSILLVLGLGGATGVLKWRDYVRWQREEYYREQEAAMKAEVFNFTIRPGETIYEVRDNLIEVGYSATEVDAALAARYSSFEDFCVSLGAVPPSFTVGVFSSARRAFSSVNSV